MNLMRKWKTIFAIIGLMILITIGIIFVLWTKLEKIDVAAISIKDLQKRSDFYLTGVVNPKSIVDYKIDKAQGVITEVLVKSGDSVKIGQVLYQYSNPEGDMMVKEAELAVTNNQKLVEQKQKEADMKWQQYQMLKEKLQSLETSLATSTDPKEKETLTQEKDEQYANVIQAEIDASTADTEIENAKLEVEKAQLTLNTAKTEHGNHEVTSKTNGVVIALDESQINLVVSDKTPEKPFMSVADTSTFFLQGKVDEFRKNDLKVGQKVKITDRNDSAKHWDGKISNVNEVASGGVVDEEQGGNPNLSQFAFEITFSKNDIAPEIGLHCFAEIVDEVKKEELTLPKEYVSKEKSSAHIWLVKNDKIVKKTVKVIESSQDKQRYTIQTKLSPTDRIIYPEPRVIEGMRVTIND